MNLVSSTSGRMKRKRIISQRTKIKFTRSFELALWNDLTQDLRVDIAINFLSRHILAVKHCVEECHWIVGFLSKLIWCNTRSWIKFSPRKTLQNDHTLHYWHCFSILIFANEGLPQPFSLLKAKQGRVDLTKETFWVKARHILGESPNKVPKSNISKQ